MGIICHCDQSTQDQPPGRVLFVSQGHPRGAAAVKKGTPGTEFLMATGCPNTHPLGKLLVDQVLVHKAPPPPDKRHVTKQVMASAKLWLLTLPCEPVPRGQPVCTCQWHPWSGLP